VSAGESAMPEPEMTGGPDERFRTRRMTREAFEALLVEVRNGAFVALTELALEKIQEGARHEAMIDNLRCVWHAAEFALGMLNDGRYLPKLEAVLDAAALIDDVAGFHESAGSAGADG
jgi:hypothetical protein